MPGAPPLRVDPPCTRLGGLLRVPSPSGDVMRLPLPHSAALECEGRSCRKTPSSSRVAGGHYVVGVVPSVVAPCCPGLELVRSRSPASLDGMSVWRGLADTSVSTMIVVALVVPASRVPH